MSEQSILTQDPRKVVRVNDEHRHDGVTGDIHDLAAVEKAAATAIYSYPVPTIVPDAQRRVSQVTSATYKLAFEDKFPVVQAVLDAVTLNVVVAGGAAAWPLGPRDYTPGDVDFFLYDPSKYETPAARAAALTDRLEDFTEKLVQSCRTATHTPPDTLTQYTSLGVMTFIVTWHSGRRDTANHVLKFQVVLRDYRSVSEILHGFDLGSSCVAYDGENVWMTAMGAWSHVYKANIVYPWYRSPTYEARLAKYFGRGYALAMPDLDVGALSAGRTLTLPHMHLVCATVHGNVITGSVEVPVSALRSADYDPHHEHCEPYTIKYRNLQALVGDGRYIRVDNDAGQPSWNRRSTTVRDLIIPETFECMMKQLTAPRRSPHSFSSLRSIGLTVGQAKQLIHSEHVALAADRGGSICPKNVLAPYIDNVRQLYQTAGVIDWWVRIDAGTQFTGSFYPRSEEPAEWYGAAVCLRQPVLTDQQTIVNLLAAMAVGQTRAQTSVFANGCCALCQGFVACGDPNSIILACGHIFHWTSQAPALSCQGVKAWLDLGRAICPTCRTPCQGNLPKRRRAAVAEPRAPVEVVLVD